MNTGIQAVDTSVYTNAATVRERVLDGFACARCGAEPASMTPDGFGERGQLFRCTDACARG